VLVVPAGQILLGPAVRNEPPVTLSVPEQVPESVLLFGSVVAGSIDMVTALPETKERVTMVPVGSDSMVAAVVLLV